MISLVVFTYACNNKRGIKPESLELRAEGVWRVWESSHHNLRYNLKLE